MNNTPDQPLQILVIDDEAPIRNLLCDMLTGRFPCTTASSAEEALLLLEQNSYAVVLSDIDLGGMSGIDIIPRIREADGDTVVVMISGNASIDSAIAAMRFGAFDYVKKPFELDHLEMAVQRAADHHLLVRTKRQYEDHLEELVRDRTAKLDYLANYDPLTGLPNRVLFEDRLSQALMPAGEPQSAAILFIALDRFKDVRDTLGHSAGERILQESANRLRSCIGEAATLSRFEGDEFAMILNETGDAGAVTDTIGRINDALALPIAIDNKEVFVTANIGVSLFPDNGNDAQQLLKNASTARAYAAEKGEKRYEFYSVEMKSTTLERLSLENGLRHAVERGELEIHYQPKINVRTGQMTGMEALVRWRHPEHGIIAPDKFIPLAEETGQIIPMGKWILREACRQGKIWHDAGFPLKLSVNLSVRQLQPSDLLDTISGVLSETGFDPHSLELEVTETSLMKNAGVAISTLSELKRLGVGLSIDDFGTGYSSLGYLKHLPIDTLKIDRSFISDVTTDQDDEALVTAIVSLAHNLRLNVVAEGVETDEQLQLLHGMKCDEWQGYLCSPPVSSDDFNHLLADRA